MWFKLAKQILKFRLFFLILVGVITVIMALLAAQLKMSYDFARAIPTDNPKYLDYQSFRKQFGEDGSMMVIGIETNKLFQKDVFNAYAELHKNLKKVGGVNDILSVPEAVNLSVSDTTDKLIVSKIFRTPVVNQAVLDSEAVVFKSIMFYRGMLFNNNTNAYLMGVNLNKDSVNSKARTALINNITAQTTKFTQQTGIEVKLSGLPFIRTNVANRIAKEMNWFLAGSFIFSAITLLLFFRSFSAMFMSLVVVAIGVIWSMGTMVLFGYKITLLTAIIPPLIVVIGVPNCIYFLNKYHLSYKQSNNKTQALITMIGKMGIVTLFCNIAAAIGFAVFALTESALLKEFGIVAGINIMALFFISLVFIPSVLSYLPAPKPVQIRYLDNKIIERFLLRIERWAFDHTKLVYVVTGLILVVSFVGITRIKSEGFIVDDLPKKDKVYNDLKWFENNFKGVMPLEIVVDTKKKNGVTKNLATIEIMDSLSAFIAASENASKPLSLVEGLKFINQSINAGDTLSYIVPSVYDMPIIAGYLKKQDGTATKNKALSSLLNSFMDSSRQKARISVNVKDIGSVKLPLLIDTFQRRSTELFDTAKYKVTFTGSSVTFLEGSSFIINGLKESVFWAFLLIAVCMLYLFRSFRMLLCSLIPNVIPLIITAGLMGWLNIRLKPSTVLVFSVALGIVIDVTIRFLVNYKQELPHYNKNVEQTLKKTIQQTGLSIIYTSLVLIAGFIIFCFSVFGGTQALGWLTSLTLVAGTFTNLILLPVLVNKFKHKSYML